jgi:mRNA-degrading endonuclease RelE of RelBE toxin-antitoxin system
MNIRFSYQAEGDLGKLPFGTQIRIRDKVRFFMEQENIFVFAKYIALKKCYRFRVGKHRLKFVIENHEAKIIEIDPRDKAYD